MRWHIGTEMSNKAETVLVITKSAENPVISEVHALHIREKEFKPFAFSVDDEGLPVMVDNYSFDGPVPESGGKRLPVLLDGQIHEAAPGLRSHAAIKRIVIHQECGESRYQ